MTTVSRLCFLAVLAVFGQDRQADEKASVAANELVVKALREMQEQSAKDPNNPLRFAQDSDDSLERLRDKDGNIKPIPSIEEIARGVEIPDPFAKPPSSTENDHGTAIVVILLAVVIGIAWVVHNVRAKTSH